MKAGRLAVNVVVLAGGVGGAKLAEGVQSVAGAGLTVIVNTADDTERHGLAVWPDHDTVLYTLAGVEDPSQGWGVRDETFAVAGALAGLGEETWFRLGDRDLATHLVRTARLAAGARPTDVAIGLQRAFRIAARILPMADEPVRTEVETDDGWIDFQEYFVHRHQAPVVLDVRFSGIAGARPTPEVLAALTTADVVLVAPSNPIVSVGPILAVPGMSETLAGVRATGVPVIAVSGILGGHALKGPADRMLASLGHEPSAVGVARIYAGRIDGFVVDAVDVTLVAAVEKLGMAALAMDTLMTGDAERARIAGDVLAFARSLDARSPGTRSPGAR